MKDGGNMKIYKNTTESLEKLVEDMKALDTLEKEYVIKKKVEYRTTSISKLEFVVNVWTIEETNVSIDGDECEKEIR